MAKYEIRDAGDARKYFTQLPNIVDDMNLSVYAFRLYVHLRRVAGDEGQCWQSAETLSKSCNMSAGMIGKAREELSSNGLINIERKKNPNGGREFFVITIADLWQINSKKYSASSCGELAPSCSELASSCGEVKNNSLKNNPEELNNIDAASKPAAPAKKSKSPPSPEVAEQNKKAKLLIDTFTEIADIKPVTRGDWGKWQLMAKYLTEHRVTPDDLKAAYYHERQYGKNPISWIGSIKARAISQHREQ